MKALENGWNIDDALLTPPYYQLQNDKRLLLLIVQYKSMKSGSRGEG